MKQSKIVAMSQGINSFPTPSSFQIFEVDKAYNLIGSALEFEINATILNLAASSSFGVYLDISDGTNTYTWVLSAGTNTTEGNNLFRPAFLIFSFYENADGTVSMYPNQTHNTYVQSSFLRHVYSLDSIKGFNAERSLSVNIRTEYTGDSWFLHSYKISFSSAGTVIGKLSSPMEFVNLTAAPLQVILECVLGGDVAQYKEKLIDVLAMSYIVSSDGGYHNISMAQEPVNINGNVYPVHQNQNVGYARPNRQLFFIGSRGMNQSPHGTIWPTVASCAQAPSNRKTDVPNPSSPYVIMLRHNVSAGYTATIVVYDAIIKLRG